VGKTLLGFDARGDADRIANVLDVSMHYFDLQLRTWRGIVPKWIPTPDRIAFRRVRKELDDIVYDVIERCRRSDREADHLLARLMSARDENGEAMSDRQLSLRLYPPAWVIGREVVQPFELGGFPFCRRQPRETLRPKSGVHVRVGRR
jgi:cytochrome P450